MAGIGSASDGSRTAATDSTDISSPLLQRCRLQRSSSVGAMSSGTDGPRTGKPPRKAGLVAVARALGVSPSTVSNAYNRPDQLSAALRERVLHTASELGYAGPDPVARSLRSGRAAAVGVVFHDPLAHAFDDPAAVLFLQGFTAGTDAHGLAVVLVPGLPDDEAKGTRRAQRGGRRLRRARAPRRQPADRRDGGPPPADGRRRRAAARRRGLRRHRRPRGGRGGAPPPARARPPPARAPQLPPGRRGRHGRPAALRRLPGRARGLGRRGVGPARRGVRAVDRRGGAGGRARPARPRRTAPRCSPSAIRSRSAPSSRRASAACPFPRTCRSSASTARPPRPRGSRASTSRNAARAAWRPTAWWRRWAPTRRRPVARCCRRASSWPRRRARRATPEGNGGASRGGRPVPRPHVVVDASNLLRAVLRRARRLQSTKGRVQHATGEAIDVARRGAGARLRGARLGPDASRAGGRGSRPGGEGGGDRARAAHVDRLPGAPRPARAREGERSRQAGPQRRHHHRARPGGELRVRARAARHRPAPEVPPQRLGVPVLEREPDGRRHDDAGRRAPGRQPDRPVRVDRRPARVRPQHPEVPLLPGRREPAAAGQPRRRRDPVRPRRQAVRDRRGHRAARADAEPRERPVRPRRLRRPVRRARAR